MTRILPADLDYTARDFDGLNQRLQSASDSVFPFWTDKSKANFGNILREMLAFVGDTLGFYLDAQSAESRFVTCTRRVNGIRHGRALNYTFRRQQAATASVVVTLRQAYAGSVTIDAGKIIRTQSASEPYRFQVLSAVTILPGSITGVLSMEHSLTFTFTVDSNDLPDQQDFLPQSPFLSVVSVVDSVGAFSEVDNFLDSSSTSAHFVVRVSEEDRASIVFGDGNNGRIPRGARTITYKTGGGKIAVEPGALNTAEFSLVDSLGNQVAFSVSNPAVSSGGSDRESLAEAQLNAPALLTMNERCVADTDYSLAAKSITGIERAVILTSDNDETQPENFGQLYCVARGSLLSSGAYAPTAPTLAQMSAIETLIATSKLKTITFQYEVVAGVFLSINIVARVKLISGASPADVDAAIRSNLADYFAVVLADGSLNERARFGVEYEDEYGEIDSRLPWSDLFDVVKDSAGVRSVDKSTFQPYGDVTLALNQFPTLGTVTLINDRTGLALV